MFVYLNKDFEEDVCQANFVVEKSRFPQSSIKPAINLFVKAVLREKRIPFDIAQSQDPFYSESNLNYIKKSVKEVKEGKGKSHELIEVKDE